MKTFTVPVTIRYSDIDMNGHVNNAVYFTYMENARTEIMLKELIDYAENDIAFFVSEASCKYRHPILLTDNIICKLEFSLLTPLRIGIAYFFENSEDNKLCAEGNTTLVMVDSETSKPIRIPEEMLRLLITN